MEVDRQQLCVIASWLISIVGVGRVTEVNQFFANREGDGKIVLLVTKVVDDFLIAGDETRIAEFFQTRNTRFSLGKIGAEP